MHPSGARAVNAVLAIPKIVTGGLVLLAIGVMLYGVFMRYVMLPITDWLDVDPINFFWVEEVGETTLAWLTLIGAAVGVAERSHFTLTLLSHHFSPRVQHVIHVGNNLLIAAFGGLVAWIGIKLAILNAMLTSPALEFSLAWLYSAATVGGILIALYALHAAGNPAGPEHDIMNVRE
ncbi:MAG TPA: TRAP transporter small permease [Acetobacteraceae bacterium]|nr:TRAP transporter small permease [Acetobacteraceae bacterium]